MGRDGIVRGAILKTGKGSMERAVQHLYPLELSCDREQILPLDPKAPEYHPRAWRDAAEAAETRIRDIVEDEY